MNRLTSSIFLGGVAGCLLLSVGRTEDRGSEFRAVLTVQSGNPLVASLNFTPTIGMNDVSVEVPNNAGGSRMQCTYPVVNAGSTYSCSVQGSADDTTTGLVVALSGSVSAAMPRMVLRKVFTVPNPAHNVSKTRAIEKEAMGAKGRLEQTDSARRK